MEEEHKYHIKIALDKIKELATFSTKAEFFDSCIDEFLLKHKISTDIDVENLFTLTEGSGSEKWYLDNNGQIKIDEEDENTESVTEFLNTIKSLEIELSNLTLEQAARIIDEIINGSQTGVGKFNRDTVEKFKKYFKDDGRFKKWESYNTTFIRYVVSRENLGGAFTETIGEISRHFILSFLKAELFIVNDFSKRIEETIEELKEFYSDFYMDVRNNKSFYFVKSFIRVLHDAIEVCQLYRALYDEQKKNEKIVRINADRKSRFYNIRSFSNTDFSIGKKETFKYGRLMESVIEITTIDLNYIVTEENIDSLFRAWSRTNVLQEQEHSRSWAPVFEMLRIKTATLLSKIREKSNYTIINYNEKHGKEIEDYRKKIGDFFKENPFVETAEKFKNKELCQVEFNLCNDGFVDRNIDIYRYDKFAKDGIDNYCENSSYFITSDLSDTEIDELLGEHRQLNSGNLYVKLIKLLIDDVKIKIQEFKHEGLNDIERRLKLLAKLSIDLKRFTEMAKTSKMIQFRPTFAYSFYFCDTDKGCKPLFVGNKKNEIESDKGEKFNYFFFASAGLSPINIFHLEDELGKWKPKILDLYFEYSRISSRKSANAAELAIEAQNKYKESIDNTQENVIATQDEFREDIAKKQEDYRRGTIRLLGVFAAFLAFVTMSVNTANVARSLFEYAVFAVIFTSALLMFVIILSFTWKKDNLDDKPLDEYLHHFVKALAPPLLIIGLMILLLRFLF